MATDTLLPCTENNIGDFIRNLSQIINTIRRFSRAAELAGATIVYSAATRGSYIDGDHIQKRSATDDPAAVQQFEEHKTANKAKIVCFGCRNVGHVPKNCQFKGHADFNPNSCPFAQRKVWL